MQNEKTLTPSLVPRFRENIGTPLSVATAMISTDIFMLCSCYLLNFYIDDIEFLLFYKTFTNKRKVQPPKVQRPWPWRFALFLHSKSFSILTLLMFYLCYKRRRILFALFIVNQRELRPTSNFSFVFVNCIFSFRH